MAAPAKERTSWLGFLWSKKSRKPVEKVRELEKDPPPRPAPKDIPAVGIDLGTSFTAVGYVDSLGVPRIFKNDFDKDTTPSVVHFSFPLKVVVGEAAVQLRKNAATNTITKIKRLIGRKHNSVYLGDQRWTCKVVRDSNGRFGVKMGKELVTPEQISAHILVYMKEIAKKVLKDEPTNAVITVPANFTNAQRQATQNAAKLAGLNVLQIINEPTAAAIAFSAENVHKDKQTVVVFDLGGGTFDVSIVEIDGRQITVLATDGLPCLGGCNFDELIYEEALARYRAMDINILEQVGPDEVDWTLMEKCEIAKKALSSLDAVMISDERYQGAGFLFTYETFVELCQGLFEQTIRLTETVMRGEGIEKNKIDEILLVGGSTRIRWIRETLAQRFPNKRIRFDINPDIVVAQGAAILADSLSKKQSSGDSFVSLFDVTPFDLGLRLGNRCKALIPKNTQIPFATYELCANAKSNERLLTIEILEGNSPQASNNETVVKVDIDIEPMPAGDNNIKVEISIDANGILSVSATDEDTCKQVSVTILSV